MKKAIRLMLICLVLVTFTVLVTTGYGKMQQRAEPDQKALVGKTRGVKFEVPSPTGSGTIVGKLSKRSDDPHSFPTYNVHLIRQDGSNAEWELNNTVYATWSADGTKVAIEDESHRVYVTSLYGDPILIGEGYTTPALSSSGNLLAAQKLGEGEHILHQVENSPGITIKDLVSGEEYIAASNDVYAPFFIGENRIGFGSGGQDRLASLYTLNLKTAEVARLTNLASDPEHLDPFPVTRPTFDKAANALIFTGEDKDELKVFELSLSNNTLSQRTDLMPAIKEAAFSEQEPVSSTEVVSETVFTPQFFAGANVAAAKVLFRMPFDDIYYQGVIQFFDHKGVDWGCGGTRYSGHEGTDFKLSVGTQLKAAAAGTVQERYDGCPDNGYFGSTCGDGFGNHVKIQHTDGRWTIYGHMKQGTPAWGSSVLCGANIGKSASSGSSSTPHVHFEVRVTRYGTRLDPYYGRCNGNSDWIYQGSYPYGRVAAFCY